MKTAKENNKRIPRYRIITKNFRQHNDEYPIFNGLSLEVIVERLKVAYEARRLCRDIANYLRTSDLD